MIPKLVLAILIVNLNLAFLESDQHFKVPLEVREKNRPKRLVDDVNDPDMKKLKNIQDQFFGIFGNSSLGKDYKSFQQLLSLVDSNQGMELSKLMVNGLIIGLGKQNSDQLLYEFVDDFQYKVSPVFADALVDYIEFIKTIDLKMIPLTIQTLFRKDELGNSLAQLPLGQLIALVQPEASKYGIDIRSVINGILGKDGSVFPDLVRKLLMNINVTSFFNGVSSYVSAIESGVAEGRKIRATLKESKEIKKTKNPVLMLFKPWIAKILQSYQIDLDADAVIQVLSPFVSGILPLMSQIKLKDTGIVEFLPTIVSFVNQFQGGNVSGTLYADILKNYLNMLGGHGGQNNNMDLLLNIASSFLGGAKGPSKEGEGEAPSKVEGSGMDMSMLIQMASMLSGGGGGGAGFDPGNLIQMAATMLGGIPSPEKTPEPKREEVVVQPSKQRSKNTKSVTHALEQFLLRIQMDDKYQLKIKDAFNLGKTLIKAKYENLGQFKAELSKLLKGYGENVNVDSLLAPLQFSPKEWDDFMKHVDNVESRREIISSAIEPATEYVALLASDEFRNKRLSEVKRTINEMLSSFGIQGITLNNFPEKLSPIVGIMSSGWGLPTSLGSLLEPLKYSLKQTHSWFQQEMKRLHALSKKELKKMVDQSLNDDVANPLVSIWKVSEASKTSAGCLPRAVCDLVNNVEEGHEFQLLVSRLGSIMYGGFRGISEDNFVLIIQTARAALFVGNCKEYFPTECPAVTAEPKKSERLKKDEHEEL